MIKELGFKIGLKSHTQEVLSLKVSVSSSILLGYFGKGRTIDSCANSTVLLVGQALQGSSVPGKYDCSAKLTFLNSRDFLSTFLALGDVSQEDTSMEEL